MSRRNNDKEDRKEREIKNNDDEKKDDNKDDDNKDDDDNDDDYNIKVNVERIDPKTVDKIIDAWSDLREEFKALQLKEKEFKRILNEFLDQTSKSNVHYIALEGTTHRLIRKIQQRRYLYRKDVPDQIFNKYSKTKLIPFIYITKKPETIKI